MSSLHALLSESQRISANSSLLYSLVGDRPARLYCDSDEYAITTPRLEELLLLVLPISFTPSFLSPTFRPILSSSHLRILIPQGSQPIPAAHARF